MPFNGAGVYSPPGADFPAVTQTVISSTKYNNVINDIATGLSLCLTKDGQQVATANIPFGGFRATNVGITAVAGSAATPAINVSDAATGLYRSAASELAVSIAGVQRGRFDATGLIVTGTVNASTSVVTPLVTSASGNLGVTAAGGATIVLTAGVVQGSADNIVPLGSAGTRFSALFTPIVDSGTTGSLSLKTNNGTEQARVIHAGTAVNFFGMQGGATGGVVNLWFAGGDANVGAQYNLFGNLSHTFTTGSTNLAGAGVAAQFQILHVASANRNITVTGSNGGNPTIGVTAGNLAITPSVAFAGSLLVGATPASAGDIRLIYTGTIQARNSSNGGDLVLFTTSTINAVPNVLSFGSGTAGMIGVARSGSAPPGVSDLTAGQWTVWRDTTGSTTKVYYNNGGAIIASAAFA
jgi:hypothetical protein